MNEAKQGITMMMGHWAAMMAKARKGEYPPDFTEAAERIFETMLAAFKEAQKTDVPASGTLDVLLENVDEIFQSHEITDSKITDNTCQFRINGDLCQVTIKLSGERKYYTAHLLRHAQNIAEASTVAFYAKESIEFDRLRISPDSLKRD